MTEEREAEADAIADATAAVAKQTDKVVDNLKDAAATLPTVDAAAIDPTAQAILTAQHNTAGLVQRAIGLIQDQGTAFQSQLQELARAQANTDISAQRAAEASAATNEAITPEEETKPKEGEQPANIKELPQQSDARYSGQQWWFGKAANRHGGKQRVSR